MTEPHDVEWTTEKVTRFWNHLSGRAPESYFSALVAPALASWVAQTARPGKFVVDVGCGGGHLLAELAKRGYRPFGVDSSPDSLRNAAQRIGEDNVALGSVTGIPIDTGRAEGLLLVETIEHILDEDLGPMMDEIRRVLGDGWPLVVTTPNGEDLNAMKVICPDCAARFHPIQHMRSWTPQTLSAFLHEHGFGQVRTFETRLPAGRGLPALARRVLYRARGDRPHLLAIART
jgi:2-polyprenyl-3-methyl-5-hydroxy-6-metoxy-1,4-benzoquinol methylase